MHKAGAHLAVDFGWYRHHGISLGDGRVVHFGRGLFDMSNACIEVLSEELFSGGKPISIVDSPTCYSPEVVSQRALSRVGECGYEPFENNCEHFVNWCRSGNERSSQAAVAETVIRQSAAAGVRSVLGRQLLKSSIKRIPAVVVRGTATAALAADAAQTVSEFVATSVGCNQSRTRRIGHRVGLGSSATIGFALGGPAGAAVTIGYWAFGQAIGNATVNKTRDFIKSAASR